MKVDIAKEIEVFNKLIDTLSEPRKSQIKKMMVSIQDRYFESPASSRIEYHDCFPGGLLYHSIRVTKNLKEICNLWGNDIPQDTIIVCGLFHDLGKVGSLDGKPLYIKLTSEDWQLKKGKLYEWNKLVDEDGLTHAQRSVRILSYHGVALTDQEYLAILFHDGMYTEENFHNKAMKKAVSRLSFLLQVADYQTGMFEQGEIS
jgi:hypothetical protein